MNIPTPNDIYALASDLKKYITAEALYNISEEVIGMVKSGTLSGDAMIGPNLTIKDLTSTPGWEHNADVIKHFVAVVVGRMMRECITEFTGNPEAVKIMTILRTHRPAEYTECVEAVLNATNDVEAQVVSRFVTVH